MKKFNKPMVSSPKLTALVKDNEVTSFGKPVQDIEETQKPTPIRENSQAKAKKPNQPTIADSDQSLKKNIGVTIAISDADHLQKIADIAASYEMNKDQALRLVANQAITDLRNDADQNAVKKGHSDTADTVMSYATTLRFSETQMQNIRTVYDPLALMPEKKVLTAAVGHYLAEKITSM